jgi:hypothetical protein
MLIDSEEILNTQGPIFNEAKKTEQDRLKRIGAVVASDEFPLWQALQNSFVFVLSNPDNCDVNVRRLC